MLNSLKYIRILRLRYSYKQFAFTLAEILITLGIIGVVAAMTIPTLMRNTQDAEFRSALQKEVSVISQATAMIAQDNGGSLKGVFQLFSDSQNASIDNFKNYLRYNKICYTDTDINGCWHSAGNWKNLYGNPPNTVNGFNIYNSGLMLNDGTLMIIGAGASKTCTGGWMGWEDSGENLGTGNPPDCAVVFLDVNGFKGPNRAGKDIFALSIRDPGIVFPGVYTERTTGIGCAGAVLKGQTCP